MNDLVINQLSETQILSSYNFARNCNIVFSEIVTRQQYEYLKTEYTKIIKEDANYIFYLNTRLLLKDNDIIFTNTYFIEKLFYELKKIKNIGNLRIVVSQSDKSLSKRIFNKKPDSVDKVYSTNVSHKDTNLIPIPLGLANYYSPKNLFKEHFLNLGTNEMKVDSVYVNFEVNTNFIHRYFLLNSLKAKPNFIIENKKLENEEYLLKLNKYKFVICPLGNGIDTHRIWETLYAGSIPVILDKITFECLDGLPVIKLKSFKRLSLDKILEESKKNNKNFNFEKLNFDYWNKIINLKKEEKSNKEFYEIHLNFKEYELYLNKAQNRERFIKNYKTYLRKSILKITNVYNFIGII